jgi:hypothetical protein
MQPMMPPISQIMADCERAAHREARTACRMLIRRYAWAMPTMAKTARRKITTRTLKGMGNTIPHSRREEDGEE